MSNIIDYMKWRSDITFSQIGINDIDCLIFSELAYLPLEGVVPSLDDGKYIMLVDAVHKFFNIHKDGISVGAIIPDQIIGLFKHAGRTNRFADVKMWGYVNDVDLSQEKQFSAVCFTIDDGTTYVAYRGTDDSIIGWKEDFNMAIYTPIPAQKEALDYLEKMHKKIKGPIIVGGHSKGGNLAVYSSINASSSVKKRTVKIYNFDGPGFKDNFISHSDMKTIDKIINILPESSIIGRIFDIVGRYEIVNSTNKGIMQHDAFSWSVMASDFVYAPEFTAQSDEFHILLKKWVSKMSKDEVVDIIETLHKVMTNSNVTALSDITSDKFKFILNILKSDTEDKKTIWNGFKKLISEKYFGDKQNAKKSAKIQISKEENMQVDGFDDGERVDLQ